MVSFKFIEKIIIKKIINLYQYFSLIKDSNETLTKKLKFENFEQANSGSYVCQIDENNQSQVDILMIDNGKIEVEGLLVEKLYSNVRINDQISQSCLAVTNVADVSPNLAIEWLNQNGDLLENSENLNIQSYVIKTNPLTKISIFTIKNISLIDFGIYECRISYLYTIKTLEFEILNSYNKIQPELNVEIVELYQGENFELICSTDEEIEKEWLVNEQNAKLVDFIDINGKILKINNATLQMNGSITCFAEKDEVQRSKTIPIIVRPALIVNITSNIEILNDVIRIESGSYLEIGCFGPLNESVQWSKDNESNITADNELLLFNSIRLEHSGLYTCQSQNERIKSKMVEIMVFEKDVSTTSIAVTTANENKYIVDDDTILEIEIGNDVTIYCITDEKIDDVS